MIFDENGKLLTGGDVASVTAMLEGLSVDAIGFNCGLGPEQMLKLLPELTACCSIPIAINPNAGLPVVIDGVTQFNVGPEEFAQKARLLVEEGASLIGGFVVQPRIIWQNWSRPARICRFSQLLIRI